MTLSEQLKKAREDSGFTLKKFADAVKIPIKYLESLEGGDYEKLPAFVYVQGFLKKYAQFFNLSFEELVTQYEKDSEGIKTLSQKELLELPSLPVPRIIVTPKRLKWLAILIVALAVIGYLIYQLDFLIAPPKLIVEYPDQDLMIERSSIEILGQSDISAKLTINGQQVYIDKDGKFRQEINLSPGVNTLKIEAENRFGKKSEITRQIVVTQ